MVSSYEQAFEVGNELITGDEAVDAAEEYRPSIGPLHSLNSSSEAFPLFDSLENRGISLSSFTASSNERRQGNGNIVPINYEDTSLLLHVRGNEFEEDEGRRAIDPPRPQINLGEVAKVNDMRDEDLTVNKFSILLNTLLQSKDK